MILENQNENHSGQVQTRALVICFNLFLVKFNQLYFPMLFVHLNVSDKYESNRSTKCKTFTFSSILHNKLK